MICKYVSGTGKEFVLNESYEVNIDSGNPYSTKWKLSGNTLNMGILPTAIKKDSLSLTITLKFRGSIEDMKVNLETFFQMCEKDVLAFNEDRATMGTLYIGDQYIKGWVLQRDTTPVQDWYGFSQKIVFTAPHPFWIHEETGQFYGGSGSAEYEYLDYPYDYLYDYAYDTKGVKPWRIDHFAESEFKMIIYGACENPRITIDGYPYEIFVTLLDREYLILDSRDKTIIKYSSSGEPENIFDLRAKENSVFRKIPSGDLLVAWSGGFGFSITVYMERSEPRWR